MEAESGVRLRQAFNPAHHAVRPGSGGAAIGAGGVIPK